MSAGTIGVTELLVGVPFPPAALETLRFAVGPATARLVLTGQTFSPAEALAVGLVDEVVEPEGLLDQAIGRAEHLARVPAATFSLTKQQLRREASQRIAADGPVYAEQILQGWTSQPARHAIAHYLRRLATRRG
jgi:enoyl-CoA hydratase